ncbi:GspH/FimT family pseudopilin [Elongatibacter sediminis]|uniref:Type II secretion system protein H n=1 Tax=Elongatibacter sediminis TaxID=3119006 RepID=A0AAW9RNZ9_9GAMM
MLPTWFSKPTDSTTIGHFGDPSASQRGFTVLEALITLAIAAVLLVTGVPALQDFGARQRMSAAMHALHGQLALARDTAIRQAVTSVACPGRPEIGCLTDSDWSGGWFVFSDFNGDRAHQPAEPVHRVEPGLEHLTIRSSNGRPTLRFLPDGSAPGSNGSITFCDHRGPPKARKLVVSNTGRIRREPAPGTDPEACPYSTG